MVINVRFNNINNNNMKTPKCHCGATLESDGTCNNCDFDATESDNY